MAQFFVDITTVPEKWQDPRRVSLAVYKTEVQLLGNLEHGTKLVIDQKLVDDLQKIITYQNEGRE